MFLRKGISIPINTLVMLAIAIIVLLATVAWFMGAFAPTATQQKLQADFRNSCSDWITRNCEESNDADGVPNNICLAYNKMIKSNPTETNSDCKGYKDAVAIACGCNPPFGIGRVTTTTVEETTTTVASTTTTTTCVGEGGSCKSDDYCCSGLFCNETSGLCESS